MHVRFQTDSSQWSLITSSVCAAHAFYSIWSTHLCQLVAAVAQLSLQRAPVIGRLRERALAGRAPRLRRCQLALQVGKTGLVLRSTYDLHTHIYSCQLVLQVVALC